MGFFDFLKKSTRTKDLSLLAPKIGYYFDAKDPLGVRPLLGDFRLFKSGNHKIVKNLFWKDIPSEDLKLRLFDYHYTVHTGNSAVTYRQTVFFVNSKELGLPHFILKPENLLHTAGAFLGLDDIDFDHYPDFSKAYYLKGKDEYLIRQLFTDEVLEYFSKRNGWWIEGLNYFLIIYENNKRVKPELIPGFEKRSMSIFDLFKGKGFRV